MQTLRAIPSAMLLTLLMYSGLLSAAAATCPTPNPVFCAALNKTDFDWAASGLFRPEMFYGRNLSLLNRAVEGDKVWYMRQILDFNFDLSYGKKTYDAEVAKFRFTLRNKCIWGNPNSIAPTTDAVLIDLDAVGDPHNHSIPRLFFWMREAWLQFDIARALGLSLDYSHYFTIGIFPFQVGRGITLGDAYAVGPELLGYYTDTSVDQFAFGAKLSGDIVPRTLTYDFYTAILQNKSSSLSDTGRRIRAQEHGKLDKPARGFGVINFAMAARMNWTVFDTVKLGKMGFEPYVVYNNDPEQEVEFLADATSKLATVGLAGEYESDRFGFGFDCAQNFGRQDVKGWDRNEVLKKNIDGFSARVNSMVHTESNTGPNALYIPRSSSQNLILASRQPELLGVDMGRFNGESIGTSTNQGELFNDKLRFRNPYINIYKGWMFVADASVYAYKKDLQFSIAAGVASGDENPNFEIIDGVYDGFIGLQEIYSGGKRVRSAFVLGGAGKLKRPLSAPDPNEVPSLFAETNSGFSDLVFCGGALFWKPQNVQKQFSVHPNVLFYWKQFPSKRFDLVTKRDAKDNARNFYGTEANLFFNYQILKDLRLFLVASSFFPGSHYYDIRGKALNSAQLAELNRVNVTGENDAVFIPNIGTDIAYTFNLGLEFKF